MPIPSSAELFFGINLSEEQRNFANAIWDNQLTIIDAPAGTGKTTVAVGVAKLLNKPMNYVFAPVQEGVLGFLPGDLKEKTNVYLQPLYDALEEIHESPKNAIFDDRLAPVLNRDAWVNALPHVFLRGSNFKFGVTTIIDEAQNFTLGELRKILTRVKDGKVIMIGNEDNVTSTRKNPDLVFINPYSEIKSMPDNSL
jgi:phosphate starvation-inducible PhoH-like protein